jgi:hypothetical protein
LILQRRSGYKRYKAEIKADDVRNWRVIEAVRRKDFISAAKDGWYEGTEIEGWSSLVSYN